MYLNSILNELIDALHEFMVSLFEFIFIENGITIIKLYIITNITLSYYIIECGIYNMTIRNYTTIQSWNIYA